MRQHAFGILAILFISGGVYFAWQPPDGATQWLYAVLIRMGLVLGAIWLAYPELSRVPPWLYGILAIGIGLVMINLKLIVIFAPVIIAIWVFWPKKKSNVR